ncbi:uncharacterized protein LOC123409547 isoform X2 [Hordeum vulgare subsp. vulgare]|uniref:uncharacterized protein LOC123409547 isoform X2 n=1 Tax=Hordeum vulgare subsp. vulgare TaxID=112509 RepID=UPI001D1A53CF|nr:uncharacterized protein LOC123409547 isoform X2 [Hordeum vulgare subsp. vulgare]
MHGKQDRLIGDRCLSFLTDQKQDICRLLGYIHGFYKEALDRLPLGAIPSLAARLLKAGMPIGFLDPVSNIIANTIAYIPSPTPGSVDDNEERDEAPSSDWILSKIITDTNDLFVFELPLSRHQSTTVARLSLDGLVSFLTSHYRYLCGREAMSYLLLARADLLTAVRLIERDRGNRCNSFSITSTTAKIALECAAVSARHPDPDVLVKASLTMASCLADVTAVLAGQGPLSLATISSVTKLLTRKPTIMDVVTNLSLDHLCGKKKNKKRKRSEQAAETIERSRAQKKLGPQLTFRYTLALKLLLLGKIHGHYLQALAKLPRDGLRKRHHRSLLRGGYCYGPNDPVSNIILNTIWYGSMFPTPQKFELQFKVDMICTDMLTRIECCSFYGLVVFLRTCLPSISEHDAIWYLFRSDADVHKAIREAVKHDHFLSGSYEDAYKQAAVVSWHDDPDALVKFATSSLNMESAKLLAILQGTLTNDRVECLTMALPHKYPPTKSEEQAQQVIEATSNSHVLSKNQKRFISEFQKKFRRDQNFFVRKVKAALSDYSQQNGVHYKLHIICGVNPNVPSGSSVALFKKRLPFEYFHVNFLATAKGPNSAVAAPQLFFAQCSNSVKEKRKRPSWCSPISDSRIDNVRCFSCEFNGAKIVHPYDESYSGRHEDFNNIARGHGTLNNLLISSCHCHSDKMASLTEDFIYFDPSMDSVFAKMNPISNVARNLKGFKGRIF